MHRISVIGHFGFGGEYLDGQTIKTRIVAGELRKRFGKEDVSFHDTHGGWSFLFRMPFVIFLIMCNSQNIIMLPAHKGLRMITPVIIMLNFFFRRSLHYVVIGGWLPEMLSNSRFLRMLLKKYDSILVETRSMLERMTSMGFRNVKVMPNCKKLHIASLSEIPTFTKPTYKLCTFSRVIKEKGIEDAIEAVKKCNASLGFTAFTLDIYGQVGKEYQQRFNDIMKNQPDYIRYGGCIRYSGSTDILKNYFALLFPTYYAGECFAGTIIDAFAAGLPVIASDWHDNKNIIAHRHTGIIYPVGSTESLIEILIEAAKTPAIINNMRQSCLNEAEKYQPEVVIDILESALRPMERY